MALSKQRWIPAAFLVILGLALWAVKTPQLPATLRVGYFNFLPFMMANPGKPPSGFTIDNFEEVARRRNFKIEWVNTTGRIEAALAGHEVDVYPQLLITPAREKRFALSAPWWQNTMVLVSRADDPMRTAADLNGRSIAVFKDSYSRQLLSTMFPAARYVDSPGNDAAIGPLCSGQAAATVAESRAINLLLARANHPCPGIDLHIQPFAELTLNYGVATRKQDAWLGRELHSTLLDMNMDGTFNRIGTRWNVFPSNQIGIFRDLVRVKNQMFWLVLSILALLAALFAFMRLYYQMRAARLEALRATEMQTRFLANMSHEIRTPLNGILGMASLLESSPLEPAQREFVDSINASGEVLLGLVNDCLDIARIESGNLVLESIQFSLESSAERVLQVLAPKAVRKGLSLACYVDPAIPSLLTGDPVRIQQILLNLMGNAIKFTETGEVWVAVEKFASSRVRITVEDTGPGIPPAARATLFERFTQADTSTTRKFGGSGLGLAIVKDLVNLMGGSISFEPAGEKGTRFLVELPIQAAGPVVTHKFAKRVALAYEDPTTRRQLSLLLPAWGCEFVPADNQPDLVLDLEDWHPPLRQTRLRSLLAGDSGADATPRPAVRAQLGLQILVAEDNPVNQRLIRSFLQKLGCDCELVENGQLAVTSSLSTKYDLILMDYQMPVLDGVAATKQIRASENLNSKTPIIAVTAGVMSLSEQHLLEVGFNSVLAKPFTLDSLQAVLIAFSPAKTPVTVP